MKKILIVAALLATTVVPAAPSFAATMAMPKASPFTCWFMPKDAACQAMMKDHMAMPMMHMSAPMMHMPAPMKIAAPAMPKMMMPAMPMMPNCTRAPAGAGHLFDCKM
jgi:hypothetical protein